MHFFFAILTLGFIIDFFTLHADMSRAKSNPDPELTDSQNKLARYFGLMVGSLTFIPAYAMGYSSFF
ncbi:hypothetical protein [Alteromonas sp. 009811495]|uniref:hypothetical protein n=1 Tax=Alteromonas sp. 009811495 TaxID=3002962 RepID=UPI00237DC3B1|nr:hypothetical protein [Alteromonas sp. 009811495]WDT84410.1 hypothetical protein OZ660_10710 [Alteromonas sp. 009811495]